MGVNPVNPGRRFFHQRNLARGPSSGVKTLHAGVKTPIPAPVKTSVKAPVVQAPLQTSVKAPAVPAPVKTSVKAPVVHAPAPTNFKAPVVQAPVQTSVKAPEVQAPEVQTPEVQTLEIHPPVFQAPLVQAPVVEEHLPVQQVVHEPEPVQVVNEPEPVQEQLHTPLEQSPVVQEHFQAPVQQDPLVQEHLPLPVEPQVVEQQLLHTTSGAFSCQGRQFGYYADVQQGCKVYHVCNPLNAVPNVSDGHFTFTCPESTRFDQRYHTCTPESVALDCNQSESLYSQTELRFSNVN